MPRVAVVLTVFVLFGCASQPRAGDASSGDGAPIVASPVPDAKTKATDIAMLAQRLMEVTALIVTAFLSPDYKNAE